MNSRVEVYTEAMSMAERIKLANEKAEAKRAEIEARLLKEIAEVERLTKRMSREAIIAMLAQERLDCDDWRESYTKALVGSETLKRAVSSTRETLAIAEQVTK